MMVVGFAIIYIYLTYIWWSSYSEQLYEVPKYRTAGGYLFLVWFGIGASQHTSILLALTALSAAFHVNKDQWNPFHSGFVAGSATVIFIAGNVALLGSNPVQWLQSIDHAASTFALAGGVMAAATFATIRTGNPIRYVTVQTGLYKARGGIDEQAAREVPEGSLDRSRDDIDEARSNIDPEALRTDPEDHPFKESGGSDDPSSAADTEPEPENTAGETEPQETAEDEPADAPSPNEREQKAEDSNSDGDGKDGGRAIDEFEFPWEEPPETRFENIGGYSDVKESLRGQVVAPLREDSESYARFGVEPSRGILFHGPPGTGKTLFARALANELNRPFVELNQADLTHEYVNKSPQIISRLFKEAQELNGVIFIDEAEQLLGGRGSGMNTHSEDQKITNTFLSALTQEDQDFIVLLTTNRRDKMDEAVLRPGRVDEEFEIGMPNAEAREKILKVKLAEIPHKLSLEHVESIAEKTDGWSGADLNNLVNQAKIEAAGRGAEYLKWEDIKVGYEEAKTANE
ncbi:AAA family ATPase [Halosimplex pelagicum]|nr:AAA family ATPase [Halosimplex pelagicum]